MWIREQVFSLAVSAALGPWVPCGLADEPAPARPDDAPNSTRPAESGEELEVRVYGVEGRAEGATPLMFTPQVPPTSTVYRVVRPELRQTVTGTRYVAVQRPEVITENIVEGPAGQSPRIVTVERGQEQSFIQRVVELPGYTDALGVALVPMDAGLRAQLKVEEGRGIVAAAVHPGYPADRAGIKTNDILLTLGGEPLAEPADFAAKLRAAGEKPVELALIRGGKPMTITVTPQFRVSLAPAEEPKPAREPETPDYYLGVSVSAPDATLRSHLGDTLPEGEGLAVIDIVADSPAAKAGLKVGDVLLSYGDAHLTDTDSLVAKVRSQADAPAALSYLRGGERRSIEIAPAERPAFKSGGGAIEYFEGEPQAFDVVTFKYPETMKQAQDVDGDGVVDLVFGYKSPAGQPDASSADDRLDRLDAQIKALTEAVEALRKAVEADKDR